MATKGEGKPRKWLPLFLPRWHRNLAREVGLDNGSERVARSRGIFAYCNGESVSHRVLAP
jgi:hypothetical protein